MLNKIVTDNNLDVQLLINLQSPRTFDETLLWDNTIYVEIDADDTATQSLEVDGGTYGSTSYPITPGQVNTIEIEDIYWNYDGVTTVSLVKGGSIVSDIGIRFPKTVDSLGMLNQDESLTAQFVMSGSVSDTTDLANEVNSISTEVEQISQDLSGKQNYIDKDILVPTGSGQEGDLVFNDGSGHIKRLYRYDEGDWVRVNFFGFGTSDPSGGQDGDIYIQNDGVNITKIWQNIGGNWYFFEHSGGGGGGGTLPRIKTVSSLNVDRYVVANSGVTELFQPLYKKRNGASFISNMVITDPLEGGRKPFKISIRFYLNQLLNKWTGLLGGVGISSSGSGQFRGSPWLQIADTNRIFGCMHFANNDTDKVEITLSTALQASRWYRAELEWTGTTDQKMYLRLYDAEDSLIEQKSIAAASNYYSAYDMLFQFGGSNNISGYGLNYGTIDRFNTYWTIDGKIKWGLDDMNHEGGAQYIPESAVATPKMVTTNFPYGQAFSGAAWSGYGPELAFRQRTIQNWGCSVGAGAYIGFKFDSQIVITQVETWAATWATEAGQIGRDATKQFKFQGSNDGTNWTDLATCNCQTVTALDESRHNFFNINNSTAYFYYRLLVTQVQTNNQTAFACVNMYE